jgi:hypothetical protein
VLFASILFELKQWNSSGNFDVGDIMASIIGGLTAILILLIVAKQTTK